MSKKRCNSPSIVVNEEFVEIEIDVTPEEDAQLHKIASADQITVPELLRREALRGGSVPFLRIDLVPEVVQRLQEMSKVVSGRVTLSPAELADILLDMVNTLEQLIAPANIGPQARY